jgi:glycosyltransferase involved in cell wall biosynthesis
MDKKILMYIPHGIDSKKFFPIDDTMPEEVERLKKVKSLIFKDMEPQFVILFNNRNIRRKQTSNIILAFVELLKLLPKEGADKTVLLLHTQPVDPNGTDLPAVVETLAPGKNIFFSGGKVDYKDLNCLYNIADVTINMANAEGFGLSTAESIMAGTPIIATVTGGLQDQMRFLDENGKPVVFSKEWGSNSDGRVKGTHGEWAFPLFPTARSLTGSVPTPYIFDDFSSWEEAAIILKEIYDLGREERKRRGAEGRKWMFTDESGMEAMTMGKRFIQGINKTLDNWTPKAKYNIYKI